VRFRAAGADRVDQLVRTARARRQFVVGISPLPWRSTTWSTSSYIVDNRGTDLSVIRERQLWTPRATALEWFAGSYGSPDPSCRRLRCQPSAPAPMDRASAVRALRCHRGHQGVQKRQPGDGRDRRRRRPFLGPLCGPATPPAAFRIQGDRVHDRHGVPRGLSASAQDGAGSYLQLAAVSTPSSIVLIRRVAGSG
jgi:hypothetical protein